MNVFSRALFAALLVPFLAAQEEAPKLDLNALLKPQHGPVTGVMKAAAISIPAGYQFIAAEETAMLMKMMGNLSNGDEIGFVSPSDYFEQEDSWFLVFEYRDVGYVSDEEKQTLDAKKMFKAMKENEPAANEARKRAGLQNTLHLQRFVIEPHYNDETRNLEWATEFLSQPDNDLVINHNIKILGRRGYVQAILVCSPDKLMTVLPEAHVVLSGFEFRKGQRYSEYRKGDKIAEYGLTGLVVGGGLALAAKSGLLQKLLKPLIIGVIAIGAFLKSIFTGRKK